MHFIHRVDRSLLIPEPCAGLRRLGSAHDGGYAAPLDAIIRARHLLVFGLAMNWDFERDAMRGRGRRAHVRKRVWYNTDRDSAAIGDVPSSTPLSLEITFVHRDLWTPPAAEPTPPLDAPNDPSKPDYTIGGNHVPVARAGAMTITCA